MIHTAHAGTARARDVQICSGAAMLHGDLSIPTGAQGVVLFAHGSGSSRHSPAINSLPVPSAKPEFGTLLFDLLTAEEEAVDARNGHLTFDIGLLAARLIDATYWLKGELDYFRVGYFGSSTGGGGAGGGCGTG
jgi:putative phosphoribosyl transferase